MMSIEKTDEMEPAVVPSDLQPSPPSKAASVNSGEPEMEQKYETIQTIKMNDPNVKTLEKPMSVMNSQLNLLPNQEMLHPPMHMTRSGISVNTKLGIIQLILSILLSAFGGLLIARNASLSMLGSGVWSGIFAGIAGALGLMNIKPLLNGFLACSLISVATSTLALALTGIGLVRDYNISQQDPVS
jgi:CD20-like family